MPEYGSIVSARNVVGEGTVDSSAASSVEEILYEAS